MILVDTDVLIDVLEDDPQWADWSVEQLRAQSQIHELAINPIVCAELSLAFVRWEDGSVRDVLPERPAGVAVACVKRGGPGPRGREDDPRTRGPGRPG